MPSAGAGEEAVIRAYLKDARYTRLDCALGSRGLMRRAFSVAIYHAHQRQGLVSR